MDPILNNVFRAVYMFWMPYFIFASFCYLVISLIIILYITDSLIKPIHKLTQKIKMNRENVRKFWAQAEKLEKATVIEKLYR